MVYSIFRLAILAISACSISACTGLVHEVVHKPANSKQMPKYPENSQNPAVSIISADASRRMVMSQVHENNYRGKGGPDAVSTTTSNSQLPTQRFTCSEPPPDVAMNILAHDALTLATKAGTNINASASLQAAAQVLSARSPHVELWRTTSWTYCNLLMNGADGDAENYLIAGMVAMSVPVHQASTPPTPQDFAEGVVAITKKLKEEQDKLAAAMLEIAKMKCDKVEASAKAKDEDCKKVEAAKAAAAAGAAGGKA